MKSKVIMMLMLLTASIHTYAQTISGRLVDEQNQPLQYANIVLLSLPDSTFVSGTISDEMGDFRLPKDEKGKLVRISSVGYNTLYKEVAESLGIIPMKPDAQLLGEVVVKANLPVTRTKGDAMVTTVTGTILEKAGNANDLLDKIPNVSAERGSVNVFGSGQAEVYIPKATDSADATSRAFSPRRRMEARSAPDVHARVRWPQISATAFRSCPHRTYPGPRSGPPT